MTGAIIYPLSPVQLIIIGGNHVKNKGVLIDNTDGAFVHRINHLIC